MAFAFNHPLFIILSLAAIMPIAASAIAGDVEDGTAGLLYTRAVSREQILLARVGLVVVAEAVVLVGAFLGGEVGIRLAPELRVGGAPDLAALCLAYFPLALLFGTLAILTSAYSSRTVSALGMAIGICVATYLVNVVGLIWHPVHILRYGSPFGYYDPITAIDGGSWHSEALLFGTAASLVYLARRQLERRDLI